MPNPWNDRLRRLALAAWCIAFLLVYLLIQGAWGTLAAIATAFAFPGFFAVHVKSERFCHFAAIYGFVAGLTWGFHETLCTCTNIQFYFAPLYGVGVMFGVILAVGLIEVCWTAVRYKQKSSPPQS
ncbi:MAG: hypothetical protein ACRDD1_18430 [Planctomycetia bacterium]